MPGALVGGVSVETWKQEINRFFLQFCDRICFNKVWLGSLKRWHNLKGPQIVSTFQYSKVHVLCLTVRSNVKPKCGNNLSESLHVFLLFWVLAKFRYSLRTHWRSDAATYCEPANSTKSPEVDLDIYQDKALRRRIRLVTAWTLMSVSKEVRGGRLRSRGCYSQPESLWGLGTRLGLRVKELCYYQVN